MAAAGADPPAPPQVLEGVDDEEGPTSRAAVRRAVSATSAASAPAAAERAAASTAKPQPMAADRRVDDGHEVLADLRGGQPGGIRGADSSPDRWIDTTGRRRASSAPPVGGEEVAGVGREVETRLPRTASARATSSGLTSSPRGPERPGEDDVEGDDVDAVALGELRGRYAVESVTTATDTRRG